jgi:hypothetical protein
MADFQRYLDARPPAEKPWWLVSWQDIAHKRMEVSSTAEEGVYEWDRMVAEIGYTFWPQIDFPDPVPYAAHPARIFITVGLYPTDEPDRWGNVDDYFAPFRWEPEPIRWRRGESDLWPEMMDDAEMDWYLPPLPGANGEGLERGRISYRRQGGRSV